MIEPTVFDDAGELGRTLAREIVDGIRAAGEQGGRFVLGCPGGRSPMTTYGALAEFVARESVSLGPLVVVMMDDYVERGPSGFRAVPAQAHYSVARFAAEHIVGPLNAAAGAGRGISPDRVLAPDPADPAAYDETLAGLGGVDLFILASGDTDGHVAFNPPGTAADTRTRVIRLADSTRRDNLGTFAGFHDLSEVPDHGVSVGIATIHGLSRRAVLIAPGPGKRVAVQRIRSADDYDPAWPATVLLRCSRASLYTDRSAMSPQPQAAPARPGQNRE